jgi:hypothetical protein
MNMLTAIARALLGLFAEDFGFALSVLVTIVIVAVVAWLFPRLPELAGGLLLVGCVAMLVVGTLHRRPPR